MARQRFPSAEWPMCVRVKQKMLALVHGSGEVSFSSAEKTFLVSSTESKSRVSGRDDGDLLLDFSFCDNLPM